MVSGVPMLCPIFKSRFPAIVNNLSVSPEAVGPSSRRGGHFAELPAAAFPTGLNTREFPL